MIVLDHHRHADELRATWQGRVLAHTKKKMAAILLSVLAHSYDEAMPTLLRVVFPGFTSITPPFFSSAARISARGRVYCEMVERDGEDVRRVVVFKNEAEMQKAFRDLADELKLSDADRIDMFAAVKRWIVCDFRLNPVTGEKDKAA